MSYFQASMNEDQPSMMKQTIRSESIESENDLVEGVQKFSQIVLNLLSCSFQIALGYICLDVMFAITLSYVAKHLGPVESAGVGLAYTLITILIMPMGFGVNQALNCHVAQALGADQFKLSKSYLTLTFYIHLMYYLPMCVGIYFLRVPFSYTYPDSIDKAQTIEAAWQYLPLMMVSSIFAIELECIKAYLISYKVYTPFIFIHIGTTLLHVAWCYIFVDYLDWGIQGAGIAVVITEALNNVFLIIYLACSENKIHFAGVELGFPFFSKFALFMSYIRSSLAIVIHIYADFLVFFMLTFVAMQLGPIYFNSQVNLSNTSTVFFRVAMSLSIGLLTYVGGEMGKRRYKVAQQYVLAGVLVFAGISSFSMTALWFFQDQWAGIYTDEKDSKSKEIAETMIQTLPYFLLGCLVIDGFQGSISGGLKGIEKKSLVSNATIFVYYVIGIPLILSFSFSWGLDWKLKGLWTAFGIANSFLLLLFTVSLLSADWEKQQEIICERIEGQAKLQEQRRTLVYDAIPNTNTPKA